MTTLNRIFISFFLLACSLADASAFFADRELRGSVPINGTKAIKRFYLYALGPCRGLPSPQWTSEGVKLGKLVAKNGAAKISNGPCGADFEYPYVEISYAAGSEPGVDTFKLYIHNGGAFTPIPVVVTVGGASSKTQKQSETSKPSNKTALHTPVKAPTDQTKRPESPAKTWLIAMSVDQGTNCAGFTKPLAIRADTAGNVIGSFSLNNSVWKADGVIKKGSSFDIKALSTGQTMVIVGIFDKEIAKGIWKSGSCSGTAIVAEQ